MPADPSPSHTITAAKSAFLSTQIRLLNSSLHAPAESPLPRSTTETLLEKVNKKIVAHNRLAFSLESQRHVVEQIDTLYWRDVLRNGLPVSKAETVVKKNFNFAGSALPEKWEDVVLDHDGRATKKRRTEEVSKDDEQGGDVDAPDDDGQQAERYAALREELSSQSQKREELSRKVAKYKKLQTLLRPFENPQENIQPNLVTRDNKELESEMAKMRILLARVGSAIQAREKQTSTIWDNDTQDLDGRTSEIRKLEDVLGLG